MIEITYMKWYNFFSYGEDNYLELNKDNVTQLIAGNGAGKTSILLILEELLYGKNHKGVKKADLLNRNVKDTKVGGEVGFTKQGSNFVVETVRSPGLKVTLTKDGNDISRHTGAQTLKLVEEILGINYALFNQLTYLSTNSKLSFLTDTDTGRKKFLVKLFQLDNYLEAHEVFKHTARNLDSSIKEVNGSLSTLNSLVSKDTKLSDTLPAELDAIPDSIESPKKASLESDLLNIKKINANVEKNNQYKQMLDRLDKTVLSTPAEKPAKADTSADEQKLGSIKSKIQSGQAIVTKINKLGDRCPTCYGLVDTLKIEQLVNNSLDKIKVLESEELELVSLIEQNKQKLRSFKIYSDTSVEFERLTNVIDSGLSEELLNRGAIDAELTDINKKILSRNKLIKEAKASNEKITKDNFAISAAIDNISKYTIEIDEKLQELDSLKREFGLSTTLRDIFSTKGLISYKLQYLVIDLQTQINNYLSELSKGKFLLSFDLEGDKLNVVIIDNGKEIEISAVSTGELAVIEISTLLAVRKLMISISGTSTNVLFLDEVISVLEEENKTTVLELLAKERNLNILVVSHGYEHPLIPRLSVCKIDGISNIGEN